MIPDDPTAERAASPQFASKMQRSPMIGEAVGTYRIVSLLGEGGFGSVYLAEQSSPVQRRVALKVIKPGMDSRSVVARFEAERQALALMDHPSVAKVFEAGITPEGRPYFVMELVRGEPITRYCELERVSVEDRARLMMQVCGAIQHAHMKGVLHRDLKPSNILVASVDGEPLAKVIDFGVAKALHHPLSETPLYTEVGQLIGTPEYMSPEQARGSADVDTRADIYALGAILYEVLSGVTPIDLQAARAQGLANVQRTIQDVQPLPPSHRLTQLVKSGQLNHAQAVDAPTITRRVRGELDWIVLKCLEKERARRYDSAAALADDLERFLNDEPVVAGPPSAAYRATKFVRRHRLAVVASAIVFVALVAGVIGTGYGLAKAKRETHHAERARAESEAVTEFLSNMIQSVQPEEFGRDVTVQQILDEASERLPTEFADRPNVEARLRHAVGLSYWGLGRLDAADRHLPAVWELRRQTLGPEHRDTLRAAANVAGLRMVQGRLAEAEQLLRQTLDAMVRTLGEDHPLTLGAMSNLAVVHARHGATDEAVELTRRVYEGQVRSLGEDHPNTLGALSNLGDLLAKQRKFDEAEALLQRAVMGWERAHGSDKPGTLTALHLLAMLELERKRLPEAEAIMRRVVETRTRVLGAEHMETLGAQANLGLILLAADKIAEAETVYMTVWQGFTTSLGAAHPSTLTVVGQLASVLEAQGWPSRAQPVIDAILQSCRAALQSADVPASELNSLAYSLLHLEPEDRRDVSLATALIMRACERERNAGDPSSPGKPGPDLWMYLDTLASAQHQAGDATAALDSQREAISLIPPHGEQYRGEMEQRAALYQQHALDAKP